MAANQLSQMLLGLMVLTGILLTAYSLPLPDQDSATKNAYTLIKGEETTGKHPKKPKSTEDILLPPSCEYILTSGTDFQAGSEYIVKITLPIASTDDWFQDVWDRLLKKFPVSYLGDVRVTLFAQTVSTSTTDSQNFIMVNTNPAALAILVEIFAVGSRDDNKKGVDCITDIIQACLQERSNTEYGTVLARPVYLRRYNTDIYIPKNNGQTQYLTFSVKDLNPHGVKY